MISNQIVETAFQSDLLDWLGFSICFLGGATVWVGRLLWRVIVGLAVDGLSISRRGCTVINHGSAGNSGGVVAARRVAGLLLLVLDDFLKEANHGHC